MIVHGYCMKCHKVKRVRVNMSTYRPGQPVQVGVCSNCEATK
jgi:hypothetical protein